MRNNNSYIVLDREIRNTDSGQFPSLAKFLSDRISISWFGGIHIITRGKPQ